MFIEGPIKTNHLFQYLIINFGTPKMQEKVFRGSLRPFGPPTETFANVLKDFV